MKILIVEDDERLKNAMEYQLKTLGMQTEGCTSGDEAIYMITNTEYDVVILDRMIPEVDGLNVLRQVRKEGILVPVIMVTAMSGVDDRIDGLEGGADDYLVKPFEMRELVARIRALGRRPSSYRNNNNQLTFADVTMNLDCKAFTVGEKQYELTVKEAELLEFFLRNHNQTVPRDLLLTRVWGMDGSVTESNLDNYIYFVRRRLKAANSRVRITTVRGIGYRLEEA